MAALNAAPEGPQTDGVVVRDPFLMVGKLVQRQYNDSAHQKSCVLYPGTDCSSCACKWWEAKIMEDNKDNGFRVRFLQADQSKGWEEAGVDLSRLRRTSIAEELTSIGVARNQIPEVDLAASICCKLPDR